MLRCFLSLLHDEFFHVKTSAEWKFVEDVAEQPRGVLHVQPLARASPPRARPSPEILKYRCAALSADTVDA